ncbi:MAG: ROK family protein [Acidimicrobiales bacterium]
MPVFVNDANCAARAELEVGVAVGVEHAVLVTLGTGIGGALIADGHVVRGAAGMAGEPGHMLVDPNGPLCVCGLHGCWERYASGAGLRYLGGQAAEAGELQGVMAELEGDISALRGEHITRAARLGDSEAAAVLDRFAWWVAVGMANCAMSDPELIIVGGGLVRDWDLYGPRVQRKSSARICWRPNTGRPYGSSRRWPVRPPVPSVQRSSRDTSQGSDRSPAIERPTAEVRTAQPSNTASALSMAWA